MIFLTAPKDLQQSESYNKALELLRQRHAAEEVTPDSELFGSNKEWRESWKSVYGRAEKLYVLAREDGTVGRGIYQQWRYLTKKGVSSEVLLAGDEETLHEEFELERTGGGRKGEDGGEEESEDPSYWALVNLGVGSQSLKS